jgi:hypothetical protein
VSGAVIGVHTRQQLREVAALARDFTPMDDGELQATVATGREIARSWRPRFGPTT